MPENDFVYAVARIRAKELSLLSAAFLEQLLALPDEAAGLKLLNEHGWGSAGQDAGTVLSEERRKTWALISELTGGQMEIFDVSVSYTHLDVYKRQSLQGYILQAVEERMERDGKAE